MSLGKPRRASGIRGKLLIFPALKIGGEDYWNISFLSCKIIGASNESKWSQDVFIDQDCYEHLHMFEKK